MRVHLPVALALLAAALPLLAAVTADCTPQCDVPSNTFLYAPPVTIVSGNQTVTWSAIDALSHTSTSLAVDEKGKPCFDVFYGPASPRGANFRIANDTLLIKEPNKLERPCTSGEILPDGSIRLSYYCRFHQQMKGDVIMRTV